MFSSNCRLAWQVPQAASEVAVGVIVKVQVTVGVQVFVGLGVIVQVFVKVRVAVGVGVNVGEFVGVTVGVEVGLFVAVLVGSGVNGVKTGFGTIGVDGRDVQLDPFNPNFSTRLFPASDA